MVYKDIKGFEGEYQIDTEGNTYSCKFGKRRLMKPTKNKYGYLQVGLRKDGKQKRFYVHRLVAEAFIPNPYNLPEVNHKNEDKSDNRVENLEFCDRKYNSNYGTRGKRISISKKGIKKSIESVLKMIDTKSRPVCQYTLNGELVKIYNSTKDVKQEGFDQSSVSKCCRGKYFDKKRNKWVNITQHNGFIWRYAE